MTTDSAALARSTSSTPWRGLTALTLAEVRRWLPWRTLAVVVAGIGVLAAVFAIWLATGASEPSNYRLGTLLYTFFSSWPVILALVVSAAAQGAVAGEVEDGTASWLIGMPVGRPAFVVAKVLGAVPGVFFAVFGTGLIALPLFSYAAGVRVEDFHARALLEVLGGGVATEGFAEMPAAGEYLGILLRLSVFMLVLVALMVLLGTLLRSQTIVVSIGAVVAVGMFAAGLAASGAVIDATPAGMISGVLQAVQAEPAPIAGPVTASMLWVVVLTGLAVVRFGRREL